MPDFKLKNVTTKIEVGVTIADIEKKLIQFGATHIHKTIDQYSGRYKELSFVLHDNGKDYPYKLPINVEGVYKIICEMKDYKYKTQDQNEKRAYKVAWRMMKDWLHAQLSIVQANQVSMSEIMLPYLMIDDKNTLREVFTSGQLQNLLPGKKDAQ